MSLWYALLQSVMLYALVHSLSILYVICLLESHSFVYFYATKCLFLGDIA